MKDCLSRRQKILTSLPDAIGDKLVFWLRQQRRDKLFAHLIAIEGLQDHGGLSSGV